MTAWRHSHSYWLLIYETVWLMFVLFSDRWRHCTAWRPEWQVTGTRSSRLESSWAKRSFTRKTNRSDAAEPQRTLRTWTHEDRPWYQVSERKLLCRFSCYFSLNVIFELPVDMYNCLYIFNHRMFFFLGFLTMLIGIQVEMLLSFSQTLDGISESVACWTRKGLFTSKLAS